MAELGATVLPLPTWLNSSLLHGTLRGIERETLRINSTGQLAQTPHPIGLGSALTHPYITTDYSESLIELITPPSETTAQALDFLTVLHQEVYKALLPSELLWPLSMPAVLDNDESNIPLAQYGSSNQGLFKTLYRQGLGLRYGRRMQTIAGIHYNISFPKVFFEAWHRHEQHQDSFIPDSFLDAKNIASTNSSQMDSLHISSQQQESLEQFTNQKYLGLIRNFLRLTPLVAYLFGASPTVHASFIKGREHHLKPLSTDTMYLPYTTSLRLGKLGYQNTAQRQLGIHYNTLPDYLKGVLRAVKTPYPPFSTMGTKDQNNQPVQINDHILQIENEYYSLVRPKQIPIDTETPAQALGKRGIAYVELRGVDIDPFSPIGISQTGAYFLEALALYALLAPSPPLYFGEEERINRNQLNMVDNGRQPHVKLESNTGDISFEKWGADILKDTGYAAQLLDNAYTTTAYSEAVKLMQLRLTDSSQTLSAQLLGQVKSYKSHIQYGLALAQAHSSLLKKPIITSNTDLTNLNFKEIAQQSIIKQKQLEDSDTLPFNQYLNHYLEQVNLL